MELQTFLDAHRVCLQGQRVVGVKVMTHRKAEGAVKRIWVRRVDRRWMPVLSCDEVPDKSFEANGVVVGVELGIAGIAGIATTSDGRHIGNPRRGRQAAATPAGFQQVLARMTQGSNGHQVVFGCITCEHQADADEPAARYHLGAAPAFAAAAQSA
ncbi:MAG: hypothetical protein ACYDHU_08210 [Acidimicrobiales bacterium]